MYNVIGFHLIFLCENPHNFNHVKGARVQSLCTGPGYVVRHSRAEKNALQCGLFSNEFLRIFFSTDLGFSIFLSHLSKPYNVLTQIYNLPYIIILHYPLHYFLHYWLHYHTKWW